jgi:hypothetical protein
VVHSMGRLDVVELESIQAPFDWDRFLEGVAVGIAIAGVFGC